MAPLRILLGNSSQCHIGLGTRTYTKAVDKVVQHLQREPSSAFIFVNTRRLLNSTLTELEGKLDKLGINADVMIIHGKQGTSKKFELIGIFCRK